MTISLTLIFIVAIIVLEVLEFAAYRRKISQLELANLWARKTAQGYLFLFRALHEAELEIEIRDSLYFAIIAFMYVRKSENIGRDIDLTEDDLRLAHKLVEDYLRVWGIHPIIMGGIPDAVPYYSNNSWDCKMHDQYLKVLSKAYANLEH